MEVKVIKIINQLIKGEELKTEIKEISPVVKQLEVTIPAETIIQEIEKFYSDLKRTVKLKGFRPGKVPRSILERFYKKEVETEVVSKLINETFELAVKEKNLSPVAPPLIENPKLEPEKDFTYTARVEVAPQIELKGDYIGLELEQEKLEEISDAEVDKYLEEIRNYHSQLKPVEEDRAIRSGDFVVIDFSSTMDGQPLKGGKVQDRLIEIKPGSFLPGFTEQLIGLRAGITREITLTLPPDHEPKEIAGKTIVFEITIKEIKEKIVPPLDDNFARDVGEFETLTDLKNHLKQELTRRKEENIRNSLYNQITQKLIENNPFEVPPSLVERQTEYLILSARSRMAQLGIPIDSSTMSNRELRDFYRPIAEFQVKRSFLLAEIAKKEGIEVSPSDIKNYLQSHPLNSEDELTGQEEGERSAQIKAKLLEDKTLAFLTEKAKIKLIEPNKP